MDEIEMVIERAAEGAVGEDETLTQQEEMVSFVAAAHPVSPNSRYLFIPDDHRQVGRRT